MIWHHETPQAVMLELQTDIETGLSGEEAAARLAEYGQNRYYEKHDEPFLRRFLKQMKSLPTVLLLIAALWLLLFDLLALYRGESVSLIPPFLVLFLPPLGHLLCALWQKRATSHLHRLSNAQNNNVSVLRDGEWQTVSAADVVRGDIIRLEAGMILPADCRLIETEDLRCDECILTGEEVEIVKTADILLDGITPMMDRINMVYAGCGVSHGSGIAVAVATAQSTEYAVMLNAPGRKEAELPVISKDIAAMERLTSLPILLLSFVILIISFIQNVGDLSSMAQNGFLASVPTILAIAAAAVPVALTTTAMIAMAMGLRHVNDRSADIRDLSVMGALSRVSVICANKTGLLTSDEKKPVSVYTGEEVELLSRIPSERAQTLIQMATLCTANDTQMAGKDNTLIGNPTESAIIEYARDIGIERRTLMEEAPRLAEIPFDAQRRCMSVVHLVAGHRLMISMGAPDAVLSFCCGSVEKAQKVATDMGESALRVLAVAYKYVDTLSSDEIDESQESNMTFGGLIALADRPREDSVKAIAECAKGGIVTVMMTGDNPATAKAVGEQLGILYSDSQLLTGEELADISDEELRQSIGNYRVFAQISAADKLRIIRAWQSRGAAVAVTGSGLADVPALQTAEVGCATGAADCDMTRDASDLTLHDNRFSSLVDVIRQSRGIYANIRKATQYTLTCGLALLLASLLTLLAHGCLPFSPAALVIYWLIGLAATVSIGYEAGDNQALKEKPRRGLGRMMPPSAWITVLWQGVLTGLCLFFAFDNGQMGASTLESDPVHGATAFGMTTAFITLVLSRLWLMLTVRSARAGQKHTGNRIMPIVFIVSFIVMALLCIIAPLSTLFGLTCVLPSNWLLAVILSLIPAAAEWVVRFVNRLTKSVKE